MDGITENEGNEKSENSSGSQDEDSDGPGNSSGSGSNESSVDLDDGLNEEEMYKRILSDQDEAKKMKDSKKKGEHLNDLVDHEMIELLNVCKRLPYPRLDSIKEKFYRMGPRDGDKKVLILDMDETMLHARFLENEEQEAKDDGNHVFTL